MPLLKNKYKLVSLLSVVFFIVLAYFTIGFVFVGNSDIKNVRAASVTLDCSSNPTITQGVDFNEGDDVTLNGKSAGNCTLGSNANVTTFTIESGATLTLADGVTLSSTSQISVVGRIYFGAGCQIAGAGDLYVNGVIYHNQNTTSKQYYIDINITGDINIDTGGDINANGLGYAGAAGADGNGPGKGLYNSTSGSGGGHAGAGGDNSLVSGGVAGGSAYCTTDDPSTMGSSGGGIRWWNNWW